MVYLDLILNLSLLVSLSIVSAFVNRRWARHTRIGAAIQGLLFGGVAVVGMLRPLDVGHGVIFDGRSIMVSLCALFFGPLATAVAVVITVTYRLWIGGGGTLTGVLVTLSSAAIGLLMHYKRSPEVEPPAAWRLYLFGLAVHGVMLALMATLPGPVRDHILPQIALPIILMFPLATVLSGKILSDQVTAIRTMADLRQAKENLAVTLKSIGDAVVSTNPSGEVVFMNPVAEALTGWSQEQACGRPLDQVLHTIRDGTRERIEIPVHDAMTAGKVPDLARNAVLVARDGTERPVSEAASPIRNRAGGIDGIVVVFRDQTEERRVAHLLKTRLALVEYAAARSIDEFIPMALDEISAQVHSPVGFFHLISQDDQAVTSQYWSDRTAGESCRTGHTHGQYDIHREGSWAQCVSESAPVVHNDFASLPRCGPLPEGHATLRRELIVPVKSKGRVVAVLGAGNKPVDYTEQDVETVSYLAEITWHLAEEERTRQGLCESEALFRNLFEHHTAVKLIIDPDTGQILDSNRAAESYYGWTSGELRGMRIQEFEVRPPPDGKPALEALHTSGAMPIEFQHRRADGSIRDVEVFSSRIEVRGKRLTHSLVHDITERKRAEAALAESEGQYRNLIVHSPDAILVNQEDRIIFVNHACQKLFGASSAEDLIGRSPFDLIHGDFHAALGERIHRLRDSGEPVALLEEKAIRLDGVEVDVEVLATPFSHGGVNAIHVIMRDITERKRAQLESGDMQTRLMQSQRMEAVGRLAGGVAHDYNNMLGVITGHAELALDQVMPANPLHQHLMAILDASIRSAGVTRQLLGFARQQAIAPETLDLNDTVDMMLSMLRQLIDAEIRLVWLPSEDRLPVRMDPSQIDQVVVNICINARDAIAGAGRITIQTDQTTIDETYCRCHPSATPGVFVRLAVSDDGCGMDKNTLAKLFDPFFTTKAPGKGTGLGLATVYGIVRQNGGFIHVYSEPEQGSTFNIYLPRHAGSVPLSQPTVEPGVASGLGETVLVVEDEPALLRLSTIVLEQLGYTVLSANTAKEALRLADVHNGRIQLLVTDVMMPEMNGRELTERLTPDNSQLRVLFMSGYPADVIIPRGELDGELHFIQKPFSLDAFARKVRETLDT